LRGFENYLQFVSCSYFGTASAQKPKDSEEKTVRHTNKPKLKLTTLDLLLNPVRTDLVYEKWSPKEIAIFESAICKFGKKFEVIQSLVKSKSILEVTEFYESWKKTSHYKTWKNKRSQMRETDLNSWIF